MTKFSRFSLRLYFVCFFTWLLIFSPAVTFAASTLQTVSPAEIYNPLDVFLAPTSQGKSAPYQQAKEETYTTGDDSLPFKPSYVVNYFKHASTEDQVLILTDFGAVVIVLNEQWAPQSIRNFKNLIRQHYYDNTTFYRMFRDYFLQGGDPSDTGIGNSGIKFPAEINPSAKFLPGTVALSNLHQDPSTTGSQFFITTISAPWLNTHYNIIGSVFFGLEVLKSFYDKYDTTEQGIITPPIPMKVYILSDYLKLTTPPGNTIKLVPAERKLDPMERLFKTLNIRRASHLRAAPTALGDIYPAFTIISLPKAAEATCPLLKL